MHAGPEECITSLAFQESLRIVSILTTIVLGVGFLALFYYAARKATSETPGPIQNMVEILVQFVDTQVKDCFHVNQLAYFKLLVSNTNEYIHSILSTYDPFSIKRSPIFKRKRTLIKP